MGHVVGRDEGAVAAEGGDEDIGLPGLFCKLGAQEPEVGFLWFQTQRQVEQDGRLGDPVRVGGFVAPG